MPATMSRERELSEDFDRASTQISHMLDEASQRHRYTIGVFCSAIATYLVRAMLVGFVSLRKSGEVQSCDQMKQAFHELTELMNQEFDEKIEMINQLHREEKRVH